MLRSAHGNARRERRHRLVADVLVDEVRRLPERRDVDRGFEPEADLLEPCYVFVRYGPGLKGLLAAHLGYPGLQVVVILGEDDARHQAGECVNGEKRPHVLKAIVELGLPPIRANDYQR